MKNNQFYNLTLFAPWIGTENMGDKIIQQYCNNIIDSLFPHSFTIDIPTRNELVNKNYIQLKKSDYSFICGTNLLNSHMKRNRSWNIDINSVKKQFLLVNGKKAFIKHPISALRSLRNSEVFFDNTILLGVGWGMYQGSPDNYTARLLKLLLSSSKLHSVRDSYTENKLKQCGTTNVINTGCPTMWNLTNSFCKKIPSCKSSNVITTLTNYNRDTKKDFELINLLLKNYQAVYIWIQAAEDYDYLKDLGCEKKLKIVSPSLDEYSSVLNQDDIEYIGTRLHAGIFSLNKMKRTLIVGVDNRSFEIAKDTNLPVINRSLDLDKLEYLINQDRDTEIVIPEKNINTWKKQFSIDL